MHSEEILAMANHIAVLTAPHVGKYALIRLEGTSRGEMQSLSGLIVSVQVDLEPKHAGFFHPIHVFFNVEGIDKRIISMNTNSKITVDEIMPTHILNCENI